MNRITKTIPLYNGKLFAEMDSRQEQITRCREMQSKCRIDDIDTFIRLSNRIEELTGKIDKTEKQLVVPVQHDENKTEMF